MPFFKEEGADLPEFSPGVPDRRPATDVWATFDPLVEIEKYDLSLSAPSASAVAKSLYEYDFLTDS